MKALTVCQPYAELFLLPEDDPRLKRVENRLMLMRGDEPMFWRRANQHPAYRPEAGL